MDQVKPSGAWRVLNKELLVSLLNGSVGRRRRSGRAGAVFEPRAGRGDDDRRGVESGRRRVRGRRDPLGLHATGRDPAYGSSVWLTFVTDAMGFFLFLGLASVILVLSRLKTGPYDRTA